MIDKLEYLLALARHRHFGRAAEACGVTQPTLSAGLRQLEASLGVLLVERGSRFRGLTPDGERAVAWATRIVADVQDMRREMGSAHAGLTGTLRLAAVPTALVEAADLIGAFHRRHPSVRFSLRSATSAEIVRMVSSLELDAGLTYLDERLAPRLRASPLHVEEYCLLTADARLFRDRESLRFSDLADQKLCLLTGDMQNRRLIDEHFARAGVVPQVGLESNSLVALLAHVRAGLFATIVPRSLAVLVAGAGGVRAVPIEESEARHTIALVVPARDPLPVLVAALEAVAGR